MKKKLLLINPKPVWQKVVKKYFSPPLAFGIISKLTPPNWDIEILDETLTDFQLIKADLVGITAMVLTANRAYEIAARYRQIGIKTIIGGYHPSSIPEETQQYADSIVVGEVENIWETIINDFENDCLKKIYFGTLTTENDFIIPDLKFYRKKTHVLPVETSRGCSNCCIFCGIHKPYKQSYRRKPVEMVLEEINQLDNDNVFFVDNNFYNKDNQYLEQLFKGLIHLKRKIKWMAGVTVDFYKNIDLLKLAAKSGCKILYTGLEANDYGALKELHKNPRLLEGPLENEYKELICNCHKNGILFTGNFIIGLESDNKNAIIERINFFKKLKIDMCSAGLLTPYPGTTLFEKLVKQNKILLNNYPNDWDKYNFQNYVFQNNSLSVNEAKNLIIYADKTLNDVNYLKSFIRIKRISGLNYFYHYTKQRGM